MDPERPEELDDRRRSLDERHDELAARLVRLRAGERATAMDLQRGEAVASARRHSADAHLRAAAAHRRAAVAHRQAAVYADRLGDPARAEEHRAAAKADEEAAETQVRAAEAERAAAEDVHPNDSLPPA